MKAFLASVVVIGISTSATALPFESYVIRGDAGGNLPAINANTDYVPNGLEFVIAAGSQKAGLGSNAVNGATIADITSLSITRFDNTTRFATGSGPAVAPYLNLWVTDGLGNFAVIGNEPSDANFQPLFASNPDGSKTYDLSFDDLAGKAAKVYETPGWNTGLSWVHTLVGSPGPLTFADLASLVILPPDPAYIAAGNGVGTGAPRELGTDQAFGVNWVFGDTLSNYVSGAEGYVVANAFVAADVAAPIPEPVTGLLTLIGLGGMGVAGLRRRR